MNKPTQQQVIEAYKGLPPPVKEFLADPDQLAKVLADIKKAHDLHIDVLGQVNESIGHLLLGLANPSEFRDTLRAAGVPESTADDIITEINKSIFVPLREQMRSGVGKTQSEKPSITPSATELPLGSEPAKPIMPPSPPPTRPVSASSASPAFELPKGTYAPPPQSPRYFNSQDKLPPIRPIQTPLNTGRSSISHIAPLPPKTVLPGSGFPKGSIPSPIDNSHTSMDTTGRRLLEDHEEPHIEFPPLQKRVAESPVTKATEPSFVPPQTVMPSRPITPPPNLPGAMPPSGVIPPGGRPMFAMPQMPETHPRPPAPASQVPSPQKIPIPPAPKSYSADPYREPIEEK